MEFLQSHSGLPVGNKSLVKFTLQPEHEMYAKWEAAIFLDEGDPMRFSYPANHPLAGMFEKQTQRLVREYKGDEEYSVCIIRTNRTHAMNSRTRQP